MGSNAPVISIESPAPSMSASSVPSLRPAVGADRLRSSEIRDLLEIAEAPEILSLAGGLPAPEALPTDRIRSAALRALEVPGRYGPLALQYGPTEGVDALRELVARGTLASPPLGNAATVIITTGSQQGLELVTRALVDPGDTVVVEDPAYLGTRQVLDAHGAQVIGIPVDGGGIDTEILATRLCAGLRPRLVSCVPNFSNPSGACLTPERGAHLAALAQQYGFVIVEDDPYYALSFAGCSPAPLARHAPDHTVTIGSASKVVAPGLRVGWVHSPPWLHGPMVRAKQTLDLHTAALPQLIALDVLADEPFLRAHLTSTRALYRTRAAALHAAVSDFIDAPEPTGGMFLWGRAAVDTRMAFAAAIAAGVAYVPGDAFTVDGDGSAHLRLSFATLAVDDLRIAAARLRTVFVGAAPRR
jgi:Transcriptional regulators containing a DNA-binding HTH domain and an aminotransferase domain (MocR family) and their eukaryotic orthologs